MGGSTYLVTLGRSKSKIASRTSSSRESLFNEWSGDDPEQEVEYGQSDDMVPSEASE